MIRLFTFDIFGTVLDWKRGLEETVGRPVGDGEFDRFIDEQGRDEQASFRPYRDITARSLRLMFGFDAARADEVGANVGRWPLFADAALGMRQLQAIAPLVATTNSDRGHGVQVQEQLGFRLAGWVAADEVRSYKPSPAHWEEASRRMNVPFGREWWHVSAYADYDLHVARKLGLTCVYVPRPHCRPGPHDVEARDLVELAQIARRT
jgi:2-haloacid dehalogenase/putative hydrolase of the HAD superfamily